MIIEDQITIDAPADVVWAVFSDVERWPEWTASVRSASMVDADTLREGVAVRMVQPRIPPMTWVVTEIEPGHAWTWTARSPGATTTATHLVDPVEEGRTRVAQRIEHRGWAGVLAGRLLRRQTRRYLRLEGEGLRRRSEEIWASRAAQA